MRQPKVKVSSSELNRALADERSWEALWWQILIVAAGLGLVARSWGIAIFAVVAMIVMMRVPVLASILCVVFALGWAFIGAGIGAFYGELFGRSIASGETGMMVGGLVGFIVGISANFSGLRGLKALKDGHILQGEIEEPVKSVPSEVECDVESLETKAEQLRREVAEIEARRDRLLKANLDQNDE